MLACPVFPVFPVYCLLLADVCLSFIWVINISKQKNCLLLFVVVVIVCCLLLLFLAITVAIDNNNIVITLPIDNAKVFGSTWPIQDDYHYQWTKVSGPASGDLIGIHDKVLELKNVSKQIHVITLLLLFQYLFLFHFLFHHFLSNHFLFNHFLSNHFLFNYS